MTPAVEAPALPDMNSVRSNRRGVVVSLLLISLALHLVGLTLFGLWVVAQRFAKPEAVFEVREILKIPLAETREHRLNVAAHEAAAPKPALLDKIVSTRPALVNLPELPRFDAQKMLPLDPSELVSDQLASLTGSAGFGSGLGGALGGLGGSGKASTFSFLGLKAEGRRLVLLFDVSGSVVNKAAASGMPLVRIKEETLKLINGLPAGARFGLIQFVRNYKPFQKDLAPVTPAVRNQAREWLETEWNESGQMPRGGRGVISPEPNGLVAVLDAAFAQNPDVIFLLSDGDFWQTYPRDRRIPQEEIEAKVRELQRGRSAKVPLHFIGFQMREADKDAWERLVRRTGGRLRELR
jgi:hypothetical protein